MAKKIRVYQLDVCSRSGVVERLSVQGDYAYCRNAAVELARKTLGAQQRMGEVDQDAKVVISKGSKDLETISFRSLI